ncbi:MAG: acylphosphatase [Ignavibacteria bacterium]|nr:acylphosphatase [Ignavibacteria bacterium]
MNYIEFSAVKIVVSGRVQGVGFRYFIAQRANELELNGYTKNLFNGDVEIVAEGRREFVEALITKAKEGPRNSKVDFCKVEWLDFKKKYDNFEIY